MSRRFLPTIDQVKRACGELPDAKDHPNDECIVDVKTGKSERSLSFKRLKFASGKGGSIYRWVYEGKVMIRSADIEESNKKKSKKDKDDDTVIFSLSVR